MGVVYLARDPSIERDVALKTVRFDAPGSSFKVEEAKARFLKEARISGRLQHPNIVTIFDVGEDSGNLYLAMEYVSGGSFSQRLADTDTNPLPIEERIRIVCEVAQALGHAHERGVIHRDVKPANILLTESVSAKVTDFGIGKLLQGDTELTSTGQMVGSPAYMSPEQIKGEKLDVRSDIFSLGVVLYQALTARKPFPADTLTTLVYQILHEEPPDPSTLRDDLPPEIGDVIRKCLSKAREDRYSDATELSNELGALIGWTPVTATTALSESKVGRATKRASMMSPRETPKPVDPDAPTTAQPGLSSDTPTIAVRTGATAAPTAEASAPPVAGGSGRLVVGSLIGLGAVAAVVLVALALRSGRTNHGGGGPAPTPVPVAHNSASPSASPAAPVTTPAPTAVTNATPGAAATSSPAILVLNPTAVPSPTPRRVKPTATTIPPTATVPPTPTVRPADLAIAVKRFVKLNIKPEQARVFLDGKLIGIADDWDDAGGGALLTFVVEGTHRLRIAYPGRKDLVVDVSASLGAKDDRAEIKRQLENGTPEGSTGPEGNLSRPDYRTVGPVRFNVDPPETVLTVNGREYGPTTQWKETDLPFRDMAVYDVKLSAPGYDTKSLRIIVAPSTNEVRAVVKEKLKKQR